MLKVAKYRLHPVDIMILSIDNPSGYNKLLWILVHRVRIQIENIQIASDLKRFACFMRKKLKKVVTFPV
jgi:hypothetical protein